jgi:hypothetical protein
MKFDNMILDIFFNIRKCPSLVIFGNIFYILAENFKIIMILNLKKLSYKIKKNSKILEFLLEISASVYNQP